MCRKICVFFIFAIILPIKHVCADTISSGLFFRAHQVIKEQRTSLLLNEGKGIRLTNGFTLEFDIRLRKEEHNYGYVFRIIANDSVSFDLISNFREKNKMLSFIEGSKLFIPFDSVDVCRENEWYRFSLKVDLQSQQITASFNNEEKKIPCAYDNLSTFRFQFGYCNYNRFVSYDVTPMTLRNIRLYNSKGGLVNDWPLKGHNKSEVYDLISYNIAQAYNPIWEIDRHIGWVKEKSFTSSVYTQVAYNEIENVIYFAETDKLLTYHPEENKFDTIPNRSGCPYFVSANQLRYNPNKHELISYDPQNTQVTLYNFKTRRWSDDYRNEMVAYTHHNCFLSPADSSLYLFGGYGEYKYNNNLIQIDGKTYKWKNIDYKKSIPPRYLGATGFKNSETVLIFGGYGNESGNQHLGPYHYFDLYALNVKDFSIEKIWEIKPENEAFTVSNEMIVDSIRNKFYVLTYPSDQTSSYILLRSFDLETGENRICGDTIPYIFKDINSFCTLYYNKISQKIYAVTIYDNQDKSEIEIYSLAYPPLSDAEVKLIPPSRTHNGNIKLILFFSGSLIFVVGIVVYYKKRKFAGPKKQTETTFDDKSSETDSLLFLRKESSILFLNGFQVWDKSGHDITRLFTPTLMNLLILIMLYTQKNKKGISNNILRETLWNDKSPDKAQNNRRVNIQKLKGLLDNLDGIELTNSNTYWSVKCKESFFSDYFSVFDTITALKGQPDINLTQLKSLLGLLYCGQPLPSLNQYWADPFIAEYSVMVQDFLWDILKNEMVGNDHKLQIQIADIMFLFDPIDENAMRLKCKALCQEGKSGLSKSVYDMFCIEYERSMGIPFEKPFNSFL